MSQTKVFLTWSGERSRKLATALKDWLPSVIQSLDPWMSESDVEKGTRWGSEVAKQLQESKIGIICLTRDNLLEPWINFEAGAISRVAGSNTCTYLFDLNIRELGFPLAQFQATKADKEDTKKLLSTINAVQDGVILTPAKLEAAFEKFWPDLDAKFSEIRKIPLVATQPPKRTNDEMLEELVSAVREQSHAQEQVAYVVMKVFDMLNRQSFANASLYANTSSGFVNPGLFGLGRGVASTSADLETGKPRVIDGPISSLLSRDPSDTKSES